ncbi:MAG TPA: hypothetical protein PLS49_03390 [Candidatus Woesebacteria bacterium]|mgnify:CR=1 FL=1|nr:hypothetical protein [Candidatus Woesebacteria bacterium]
MPKEIQIKSLDDLIPKQTCTQETFEGHEINFDEKGRRYIWFVVEDNNLSPEDTQEVFIHYLDD